MPRWICKVCGYVHTGPEPPEICPICGAPASEFERLEDDGPAEEPTGAGASAAPVAPLAPSPEGPGAALGRISYGLFVVTTRRGGVLGGQTANTVFQITADPPRVALGINKANHTHGLLSESGVAAVNILGRDNLDLVRSFGFRSGRDVDKFDGVDHRPSPAVGCPVLSGALAWLELRLDPDRKADAGSHTIFVGDVVGGGVLREGEPMTYAWYRENRPRPTAADSPRAAGKEGRAGL